MKGPWIERLEAIAVARELVAVGGRRDAAGVTTSSVHVVPLSLLENKGAGWSLDARAVVRALAFAGDELLLSGGDDGRVIAWDVTDQKATAELAMRAAVHAIAVDANVLRGAAGTLAVGTADGAVHVVAFAIANGTPSLTVKARHALSDGPITALAYDPAGLWVAGGADGQLRVIGEAVRTLSPGGDGGIRAVACLGDGRAAIGCGDGSVRTLFVVGDVEAHDRSGDHGHQAAVRAIALGPILVDDAGREQPRRLFSAGEDGAIKSWFIDGGRRPKTIDVGIGALTALVFAPGPVAKGVDKATGRLWTCSLNRKVATVALDAAVDIVEGTPAKLGSILDSYEELLRDGKAAAKVQLEVVARLTSLAEDEARELLDLALSRGHAEVRVAATQAMVRSQRRASRPALRVALNAEVPELRGVAFHALRDLEPEQPIAAIRAGLASRYEDVRIRAVQALIPLARTSVIAAGLVADALRDAHPQVRNTAFTALTQIQTPIEAVRTTLARGNSDVRATALVHLALVMEAHDAAARGLTAAAFDDADPTVRTAAFLASVMQRPRLAGRLLRRVPALQQTLEQLAKSVNVTLRALPDEADLDDDELEPLFAQLACRSADAAIRGAGALLALGDPRAVGAVLQLTREADPALRRGATSNLVLALATWPDDDRLSARLIWLLDDVDHDVRSFAFDALAKTAAAQGVDGELDLAELALRTSQEDIRVRALQILVRVGASSARASRLLGDALDDEATKVRSEAFRTLWAWHTADPMVPLARGAASRHADLRTQVVHEIDRRRQAKQASVEMENILRSLVSDAVGSVGLAAFTALTKQPDDGTEIAIAPEVYLAAMASPVAQVRAAGAAGSKKASAAAVRGRLVELIKDDNPAVHTAAVEALDAVAPNDAEGFALALGSIFYGLAVRAGELLGARRDGRGIEAMKRLLTIPKTDLNRPADMFRHRASRAIADVGDIGAIAFQRNLIDQDEDPIVRENAARGLATAAQPGHEPSLAALVALLGHADLPVRSWGGEGLAKLGDLRALPVLAGTQRHDHRPLRIGAIVGFVALGPDGVRGLRQGLEDRDREIQDLAFAVIVARDAALAQAGIAPDLLVDAVSSPSPEIRFAAARLLERRARGEAFDPEDIVGPRKPEKATDMKDWPPAPRRAAILQVIADAIASDEPTKRYASAQVLALRTQPLAFWKEAARLAGPSKGAPAPHTSWSTEKRVTRRSGWLRRLVGDKRDPEATELENLAKMFLRAGQESSSMDAIAAQRLVFGVYAGLVRQAPARGEADETHRVRRDGIGRLVELAREEAVGVEAVLPVLSHAVGDPHHLVRQASMAALRSLYPIGALAPLQMAIGGAADLGKAALEELVALAIDGDDRAAVLVRSALDADDAEVRAHAALRLAKLYPAGSAEPQLLAAQSKHADVRLAAITQLASAADPTPAIIDALVAALGSEHADLRLRAAVALARRGNAQGIDVLGAFLRSEDNANQALQSLIGLADRPESGGAAADVIAARIDDDPDRSADRYALIDALSKIGHPNGAPAVVRLLVNVEAGKEGDLGHLADFATAALSRMIEDRAKKPQRLPDGRTRTRYREDLALAHFGETAKSPLVQIRLATAKYLGDVDDRGAEDILARLISDRDETVRVAAAESLALRAEFVPGATLVVLEAALRGGRRELVLPAALGLAARRRPEAFQPLLLVAKAGEPPEMERALLALGSLGDRRALDHLLPLLDPAPEDETARALTPAAVEALGRLVPSLAGDEANEIRSRVERIALAGSGPARQRAITGLRYAGELATLERIAADREARNDVRAHAIKELGLAAAPTSEPILAELLSDDDHAVREAAITSLTTILGDRTRVSLHALASPHDHISRPAATYLATAGDPATLVARLGTVKSPDLRRTLREGLIRRGSLPEPELAAALAGDAAARAEAAWIVGYAGPAAARLADAVTRAVARSAAEIADATSTAGSAASARVAAPQLEVAREAYWASLWAARRVHSSGAVAVEAAATAALADVARTPARVREEAAAVLAAAGSGNANAALANVLGDAEREVRTISAATLAARNPGVAPTAVRALGSRADATTIAPLAWTAWPTLAKEMLADPSTRYWAVPVSLSGARTAELVAIATANPGKHTPERLAAIAALGRLASTEALAALEQIHNNDDEDDAVKLAAWKALRRIQRKEGKVYAEGQDKGGGGERSAGGDEDSDDGGGDGDDADNDDGDDDAGDDDDDAVEDEDEDEDEDDDDEDDDD